MPAGRTLTVTVPEEVAAALDQSVRSGEFPTPSDALVDAAKYWQERRTRLAHQKESIRRDVTESLNDPSPVISIEEVERHFERLAAEAGQRRRNEEA